MSMSIAAPTNPSTFPEFKEADNFLVSDVKSIRLPWHLGDSVGFPWAVRWQEK